MKRPSRSASKSSTILVVLVIFSLYSLKNYNSLVRTASKGELIFYDVIRDENNVGEHKNTETGANHYAPRSRSGQNIGRTRDDHHDPEVAQPDSLDHQDIDISKPSLVDTEASSCPSDWVQLEDTVLPQAITQANDTKIPRVVHFIIRDRCVPTDIADNVNEWKKLKDYSLVFHDQGDVDEYLSRERTDLPFIPIATKCAIESIVKSDLAKLLILWDMGGLVADIDTVPGPSFLNGTTGVIDKEDECILDLVVREKGYGDYLPPPRFMGCTRRHFFIHSLLYKSIANHYYQVSPEMLNNRTYTSQRGSSVQEVLQHGFYNQGRLYNGPRGTETRFQVVTASVKDDIPLQSVTLIQTDMLPDPFLTDISISNSTKLGLQIIPSPVEECVDMSSKHLSESDLESLLQLVGKDGDADDDDEEEEEEEDDDDPCYGNENLTAVHDTYNLQSISNDKKIPKIVHMTSKTRCVTDPFVKNINLWRFDDYSYFLHDDEAVGRLLDRVFVEFPLLQDMRHCIPTGAGLADLWRYVVLWEYGGVYTDIDSAPGRYFANGTIIEDSADYFVIQEGGGFISQFFMAASPRHPLSFYAVQHTISRLLDVGNIALQNTAVVTGPGATKVATMSFIGEGYPDAGNYNGTHNRSMTVVDSKKTQRQNLYIRREGVKEYLKKREYKKMNMTHFHFARNEAKREGTGKHQSCLAELYKHSRLRDEDKTEKNYEEYYADTPRSMNA